MDTINWVMAVAWYAAFLLSVVLHEASHAWVALKLGDRTAYQGGQVTLDPLPHVRREPFGMVVVPLISFLAAGWMIGWGSTPYDPQWSIRYPKRSAYMALAGPLSNILIALVSGILLRAGLSSGLFELTPSGFHAAASQGWLEGVAVFLGILFLLNLILAVFNLLPVPPLDGSVLPLLVLPARAGRRYLTEIIHSPWQWMGLFVAWSVFGRVFPGIAAACFALLTAGLA